MIEDKSYKQLAIDKLTEEYEDFKNQLLSEDKTREYVFGKAFEIYTMTRLYHGFRGGEFSDGLYYAISQAEGDVLKEMCYAVDDKQKQKAAMDWDEVEYIEAYCERNYSDEMNAYEEKQQGIAQG